MFGESREGEDVSEESAGRRDPYRDYKEFCSRYSAFIQYAKQIPVFTAELQGDIYVVSQIVPMTGNPGQ